LEQQRGEYGAGQSDQQCAGGVPAQDLQCGAYQHDQAVPEAEGQPVRG